MHDAGQPSNSEAGFAGDLILGQVCTSIQATFDDRDQNTGQNYEIEDLDYKLGIHIYTKRSLHSSSNSRQQRHHASNHPICMQCNDPCPSPTLQIYTAATRNHTPSCLVPLPALPPPSTTLLSNLPTDIPPTSHAISNIRRVQCLCISNIRASPT